MKRAKPIRKRQQGAAEVEVVGPLICTSREEFADAIADLMADLIREGKFPLPSPKVTPK